MLSYEWFELESLCERISDLRHRYTAAQRTQNAGLIEGLRSELARATRHRALLLQHISTTLGSAAAEPVRSSGRRFERAQASAPPPRPANANRTMYCLAI